jgi:hypothetical protein
MTATEGKLELVKRALRHWDPKNVVKDRLHGLEGSADGEYDSLAAGLLKLIEKGYGAYNLSQCFAQARSDSMGLGVNQPSELERKLAEELVAWRESDYSNEPDFSFQNHPL